MLYLFIDSNRVKVLQLKKSILGQYETRVFSKTYQSSNFLEQGKISSVDFIASAVKEALQSLSSGGVKNKDTLLILPQESYVFLRIAIPSDIASSAISTFIVDKARSNIQLNLDDCSYDYFLEQGTVEKYIHFYAIENEVLAKYREALHLIDLKLNIVLPEAVTYFKLFQKTLRKDKKENIFYVTYDDNKLTGLLYDSFGQVSSEKWIVPLDKTNKVEEELKRKAAEFEQKGTKLNRLILAGEQSEKVRQDTFTKEIGVWTNPLKRIIPEFYQDYLKLLLSSSDKPFSVLSYEACVGAFIFNEQNKDFSFLNNNHGKTKKSFTMPKVGLVKKEVIIFLSSFILSFLFFVILSNMNLNFHFNLSQIKPKVTPTLTPTKIPDKPTVTPTPAIKRDEINIKVLNGSGTVGKASEVKDLLKENGYQEILTGNADNFEYEQTELQVKKSKSSVAEVIKNDLKENVASFKETVLDEDEAADVVIIIGSDFK
ncbi:hypothetical protein A2954_07160 [Candidatus Roizmanbacteria bacterium RIFCSPLOWO2_01_FULL_37_12]|uniref:LytR/CpsA/Psr regulator C-terminal domain-containing protein n=1 Tax=Candidatus Roizmanbacteria bacterium RIFCSPLOWO2_01_FULL_37_12 TaxID=1802056 RepID=A0A1F7IE44_9BACT|nr:MAG: hypothetical protein A3D76_01075 [Candidatus Roizmanbacteria bacterium RIFCSPHIGHO2_02_FULL_37_9b]OGK41631.1 MAG: hypothetical protein A2954_07160 [Candidatus Roizmanbacteria bacterium RIFCSPLOWO2_01_FULL_37_12]